MYTAKQHGFKKTNAIKLSLNDFDNEAIEGIVSATGQQKAEVARNLVKLGLDMYQIQISNAPKKLKAV